MGHHEENHEKISEVDENNYKSINGVSGYVSVSFGKKMFTLSLSTCRILLLHFCTTFSKKQSHYISCFCIESVFVELYEL